MTLGSCWLRAALLGTLACAPLPSPALSAPTPMVEFSAVRVGVADCYKLGAWTQVELVVRADRAIEGRVEVVVPDGDGVPVRYATPSDQRVQLAPDRSTQVLLYARLGRPTASLVARFYCGEARIAERTFASGTPSGQRVVIPAALELEERLFLVVGPGGLGLAEAMASGEAGGPRVRVVELSDPALLPDRWFGYEGVDLLVLSTTSPELLARLDGTRREAIDTWVRQGGKMLLTGGPRAERVLGREGALAGFVPGRLTGVVGLRQTEALETYCQSTAPVPRALEQGELGVARLADTRGIVESREADLPLVVRAPHGFGQVVYFAAELERPPLAQWKGRGLLLKRLLDLPADEQQPLAVRSLMHFGFVDIAGQLRAALDQFPGVRVVPFWLVAALVTVYIVLIGPVDYFVLRRFGRRMVLTWITFPATVLVVGGLACVLAIGFKGRAVHTSQVDLVEVDTASGLVRGTTWAAVFSPRPDVYQLALRTPKVGDSEVAQPQVLAGWLGMAGRGLGGMAPQATVPAVWPREYQVSPDRAQLLGLPVPQWSTKGFTARWTGRARIDLEASLAERNQVLEGSLRNTLPIGLTRCLLVYSRWAYDLGDLPAGRVAALGESTKRSELRTHLTGRRIVFDDTRSRYEEAVAPYDLAALDAAQILQTMMFFQAAGGSRYTSLVDNYQGFVDASGLLQTGRAMLVGFASPDAVGRVGAEWLRDGRRLAAPGDPHIVALRFVLPVEAAKP